MKVIKHKKVRVIEDIGPLDGVLRLPMASRIRKGMVTICDACGEHITDEWFIAGFKAGERNLKLHEKCAPASPQASTTTQGGEG